MVVGNFRRKCGFWAPKVQCSLTRVKQGVGNFNGFVLVNFWRLARSRVLPGDAVEMTSVRNKHRVIVVKNFYLWPPLGIALSDDAPAHAILNTLALLGLVLNQHFGRSCSIVSSLWQLKLLFVWKIVRFVVLRCYFFDRVTKLSCLKSKRAFANFFL